MSQDLEYGEPEDEDDEDLGDEDEDGAVCEHGVSFSDDCEDCDLLEDDLEDDDVS